MYHDTPLMVRGVLYTVTSLGQIAAIDPATGQTRWIFDPESWKNGRPGNLGFVHRGLAYWSDGTSRAAAARDGRCLPDRGGCEDRAAGVGLRRWRAGGSHGRRGAGRARNQFQRVGRAHRGSRRRSGGVEHPRRSDTQGVAARRRDGLRRPDGAPIVDLPVHPAEGRVRLRLVDGRRGGLHGQHERLDEHVRGRGAGPRLPAVRHADQRLLRRASTRTWPVRREPGGGRGAQRPSSVALPAGASRRVGLRPACRTRPGRSSRQRTRSQGHRAGHQAGLHLRVRSPDRPPGLAHRGAARAPVDGAGRAHLGHAAVSLQAAGVRAPGPDRRRTSSTSRRS